VRESEARPKGAAQRHRPFKARVVIAVGRQ